MRRIIILLVGLVFLAGCGPKRAKSGVVEGTVTYKSKPVNGAMLILYPTSGEGEFQIPVNQEGAFKTADVPPGEYKVIVQVTAPGGGRSTRGMTPEEIARNKEQIQSTPTIPIPAKYQNRLATDLTWKITPGEQKIPVELKD